MDLRLYRVQRTCHWSGQPLPSFSRVGRWHSGGRRVLYLAENPSLATLEWMKGMMSQGLAVPEIAEIRLVMVELTWDLDLTALPSVDPAALPPGWRAIPNPHSTTTQALGNAWLDRRESLALRVPSATLPDGCCVNVLVNPGHPDYPIEFPPERIKATAFDLGHYLGLPAAPMAG